MIFSNAMLSPLAFLPPQFMVLEQTDRLLKITTSVTSFFCFMTNATIPFFILHSVIYISVCLLPYGVLGLWRPHSALLVGNA